MAGGTRGRLPLVAQRSGPKLGPPRQYLNADEVRAWNDIVAAAPDVLRATDSMFVGMLAVELARWRAGHREPGFVRDLYRYLGEAFISMRERRRLLFPERPRRR